MGCGSSVPASSPAPAAATAAAAVAPLPVAKAEAAKVPEQAPQVAPQPAASPEPPSPSKAPAPEPEPTPAANNVAKPEAPAALSSPRDTGCDEADEEEPMAMESQATPEMRANVAALLPPLPDDAEVLKSSEGIAVDAGPVLQWITDKNRESRMCWLTGRPGQSTLAVSAELIRRSKQSASGFKLLHHFVRLNDVSRQDPITAIRALAFQLFEEFPQELEEDYLSVTPLDISALAKMDTCMARLLANKPVQKVLPSGSAPVVILIDGLDEGVSIADTKYKSQAAKSFRNHMLRMALRLLSIVREPALLMITSVEPEGRYAYLEDSLGLMCPVRLTVDQCLSGKGEGVPPALVGASGGTAGLSQAFADCLDGVDAPKDNLKLFLNLLLAAREPLSLEQFSKCGVPDPGQLVKALGGLFRVSEDNRVYALDKSVFRFLAEEGPWHIDEEWGHRAFAQDQWERELKAGGPGAEPSLYCLRNAVFHASKSGLGLEDICGSVQLWQACYGSRAHQGVQDLLHLQKKSGTIRDAARLLITNHDEFATHPEMIVQRAYDAPKESVFASAVTSSCPQSLPPGKLLTRPRLWPAEVLTVKAHSRGVNGVSFSSEAMLMASASDDCSVKVLDAMTGVELLHLTAHTDEVNCVLFSPDDALLASASWDCATILWDLRSGREKLRLKGHTGGVTCLAFKPDSSILVTGSDDKSVRVWDVAGEGQELLKLSGHAMAVNCVAINPEGTLLASGGEDATITIWDLDSGEELQCLEGHESTVQNLAFAPDSSTLVSGSWDKTVRIWNAATGESGLVIEGHSSGVTSVGFTADGKAVVSSSGRTIHVWDAASGEPMQSIRSEDHDITSLCMSNGADLNGSQIVSGSRDGSLQVWELGLGSELEHFHTDSVNTVAVSADGSKVLTGSWDCVLGIWAADSGDLVRRIKGHTSGIATIAVCQSGLVASGSDDHTVKVWDMETGEEQCTLEHEDMVSVTSVAINASGSLVASGSKDMVVRVWDLASKHGSSLTGHTQEISSVSMDSDGNVVVSGGLDSSVRVWDVNAHRQKYCIPTPSPVLSVCLTADAALIGSSHEDGCVCLWDAATGDEKLKLSTGAGPALALAVNADGSLLAGGCRDGVARLWSLPEGKLLQTMTAHTGAITDVAFSPDSSVLYTSSEDQTARVWAVSPNT